MKSTTKAGKRMERLDFKMFVLVSILGAINYAAYHYIILDFICGVTLLPSFIVCGGFLVYQLIKIRQELYDEFKERHNHL